MAELHADPLSLLRARTSEKWVEYPADVLPLFVAEMDYPLAPVVAEAIIGRVRASDTGYVASARPVGDAFAGFAAERWGWQLDPELVTSTTDVSVAIVEVLRRVLMPGDGVIIMPPVYPPFFDLVPEAGGRTVEVPLAEGDAGWSIDLAAVEDALRHGARAILLCNPHNPLGLVHPREQLEALARLAAEYSAWVVSDEIHGPLSHRDARFVPFLSVSDDARDRAITVTSASKAFNLAGVKCAIMVAASANGAEVLRGLPDEVLWRTSLLGLHASVAGFRDGGDWLDSAIHAIEANRAYLSSLLALHLPAVRYREPQASYLAWLDFREQGWGDDPAAAALESGRVALNSGRTFGVQGSGFARLNFACGPDVLEEALRRLGGVTR
ncbi:MalY/PatB family protein [Galbitalea soli]|uniref:cysteine-S-conjugate beta-lyase n=1 Tax=Galbitalea soli TaxID=1268042 RepID=A0A7C9TSL2_9MICO|nr:aminotransferase class I/II-fold pyridoxal phosphate-dependent enzyme [Galbitalea soli]NEM92201.1 aminotransferase class I/II-fold pyridoxal phosphate-dependent enzyme [Galbitalea soli]NYJ31845.1 cystathionine beta-lyase [Galbitalea soli]